MSKDYKAAYRYARSFFLIMKGKSRQAEGNAELERVLAFSGSHPEFSHLLLAANLAAAEKAEIIDNLFSGGENKLSDQAARQGRWQPGHIGRHQEFHQVAGGKGPFQPF